jgi:hypothetical protein
MRWRALIALGLVLAGSGLVATTAAGKSGHRDPVVDLIVRDCAKDDDLDVDYPLGALRRALDALPRHVRRHTRCERVIERAIERAERRLDREVLRIWSDCGRDDDLDRDYSVRALRRALRLLPDDLRMYTGCERSIERALERAQRRLQRQVDRIIRDCERDGRLDRDYDLDALFRALRRVAGDKHCERAIVRAIQHS